MLKYGTNQPGSRLKLGDNAPGFEGLNQNAGEETVVLFMGKVARSNANEKSKALVKVINESTVRDTKICLVWDANEEDVQAYKATVPGLIGLNNVCDIYDTEQTIQKDWQILDSESEEAGTVIFVDALVKDGKIAWIQSNQNFYELLLVLRGWRP
jgi:hypothetical protein